MRGACRLLLATALVGPAVPSALGASSAVSVSYVDALARTGIGVRHPSSKTSVKYLVETMGGGVALFDANGDGRLDLFFTNGARLVDGMGGSRRPDKSDPAFWNRLYLAKGDGTYRDATVAAGLAGS